MSTLLSLLTQALSDLHAARYTAVCPLAWLLYSHFLSLSDEINLFWNRRWSIAQLLFFLIRYPPLAWELFFVAAFFATNDTPQFCKIWGHDIIVAAGISTLYTIHGILILRLYGLYGSKKLLYTLLILLCVTFAAELYIAVSFSPTLVDVNLGPTIGSLCDPESFDNALYVWIPILVFEIAAFACALYKGLQQFKIGTFGGSRLMQIMIRDSLAYFLIIVVVDIANLVVWIRLRTDLRSVTYSFTATLMSFLGSQMLMNIRLEGSMQRDNNDSATLTPTVLSTALEFNHSPRHMRSTESV